jgi:hypothetical protein
MSDYQEILAQAEEQLFANIKQAQELNLAAVGVIRSLAQLTAPTSAEGIANQATAQATDAVNRSVEFTTKLMQLQNEYATRLLAELGPTADKG